MTLRAAPGDGDVTRITGSEEAVLEEDPCPHCGSHHLMLMRVSQNWGHEVYEIQCADCGARFTREYAISKAWDW